ncbi:hypothetical protein C5167_024599 [Papaver somniferum]|uniref:Uncharacterized protein n=1 Tax=Papaver somniferum TaxID=3469 RepID=A0A4Y7JQL5_PAPSO|nr:hypothetical protein C5167_024599 [Papaver somniferum]
MYSTLYVPCIPVQCTFWRPQWKIWSQDYYTVPHGRPERLVIPRVYGPLNEVEQMLADISENDRQRRSLLTRLVAINPIPEENRDDGLGSPQREQGGGSNPDRVFETPLGHSQANPDPRPKNRSPTGHQFYFLELDSLSR